MEAPQKGHGINCLHWRAAGCQQAGSGGEDEESESAALSAGEMEFDPDGSSGPFSENGEEWDPGSRLAQLMTQKLPDRINGNEKK